ncbi:MAG: hypothetical protein H0T59_07685 [Chloroflexi bacterium]|nr:hypothetical protein [Chloroflexota bacterium]
MSEDEGAPDFARPASVPELAGRMAVEVSQLEKELTEVDLLIDQARTEAGRHDARRVAVADKLAAATKAATDAGEGLEADLAADLNGQLVMLTKRAALMESQVDVLEGKRRTLRRYRDGLAGHLESLAALGDVPAMGSSADGADSSDEPAKARPGSANAGDTAAIPPAVSRLLLGAQEDLRREIARAMHDGPAQSLTNIVLQAHIVERLVGSDPTKAEPEVRQLVAMVQQTLEATKSFIFDVRPMVLDDLGLVPTLRRSTRERGRRVGVPIDFDSMGADRRLPMDLESGLFRILDEAMGAYVAARADRVSVRLDWSTELEAHVSATREVTAPGDDGVPDETGDETLPPALAAMMAERRTDARQAREAAQRDAIVVMPPSTWREIQARAATLGMVAELLADGSELRLAVQMEAPAGDSPEA